MDYIDFGGATQAIAKQFKLIPEQYDGLCLASVM